MPHMFTSAFLYSNIFSLITSQEIDSKISRSGGEPRFLLPVVLNNYYAGSSDGEDFLKLTTVENRNKKVSLGLGVVQVKWKCFQHWVSFSL
ncbi:CLUMA_CG006426, isoform A [Clunio marinus]|uniref:CLUMA_CG006426, isoform A n=1 Tax=Clunio marinus TaxID=568069 RepID=A0A1J1HXT9_9DIPT|nr:CLUMA_CG006426, isoform A [Clunio marinus]